MPSPEVIDKALTAISKRGSDYRFFFENLSSPEWIPGLRSRGLFRQPPRTLADEERVSFPSWPESQYLARMAAKGEEAASLVLEVIAEIPDTDNVLVLEDLLDAANAMPPGLAVEVVGRVETWIESPYQLRLFDKTGLLIRHLAKGGFLDQAVTLARRLFQVSPSPRGDLLAFSTPQSRVSPWEYQQVLFKCVESLAQASGSSTLVLLMDLYEQAVNASSRGDQGRAPEDYSYIWWPDIERPRPENPRDVKETLIVAVRELTIQEITNDHDKAPGLLRELEKRQWDGFLRIAFHILRMFPDIDPVLVERFVTNPAIVNSTRVFREFWLMVRDRFDSLPEDARGRLFGLVDAGPEAATPHDTELRERWKYRRFAILSSVLPKAQSLEYEELRSKYGSIESPEYLVGPIRTFVAGSPISREHIEELSVDDLIGFLSSWVPKDLEQSPTELSRTIQTAVASNPGRYSSVTDRLRNVDAIYLAGFIRGFADAVKEGRAMQWTDVLELSLWIVSQPREIHRETRIEEFPTSWGWVRQSIAELLSNGLQAGSAEIPWEERDSVLQVLEELAEDPDPTPEDEAQSRGFGYDPSTASINSVRGQAMHALVRYALWAARALIEMGRVAEKAPVFQEMPEVPRILDHHLDLNHESSLAIRSVYGQWFPWLVKLDRPWATDRKSVIFPLDDQMKSYWDAAWRAYVSLNIAYDDLLPILGEEYRVAIRRIAEQSGRMGYIGDPNEHLAEHLMAFYLRGALDLGSGGLLNEFFSLASPGVRLHALGFVGRALHNDDNPIQEALDRRLNELIHTRLEALADDKTPEGNKELSGFGWWFSSGRLDDRLSLTILMQVLVKVGTVEVDHQVVERLADLSHRFPRECVQALTLFVRGSSEPWEIHMWTESAMTILRRGLQSGDEFARQEAIDLVHELGARGHANFAQVLN